MSKKISVIIPVYKVEQYFDRCVESIVEQSYTELEIILVDDGSPDNCPAMCDEWAKCDRRIKVIHKENGGLSDARNAGLKIVTGDYISFVDSDDWLMPKFYEIMMTVMEETESDIVECGVSYIDELGNKLRCRGIEKEREELNRVQAIKRLMKEDGVYQTVWNKIYRREVIGDIAFEKGKLHEDDFWTYQIFDRASKVTVINQPLYCYFQRSDSIMGVGYRLKNLDGLEARHRQVGYFANEPELGEFVKARVLYNDMYHFQAALKYLKAEEQKTVTDYIIRYLNTLGKMNYEGSGVPFKYRLWFALFQRWPFLISNIRNRLGIG